jgi:heat shock protein HtpX
VISIICLAAQGHHVGTLLIGAAVFGFGGALISLALSKWMAKRVMGVSKSCGCGQYS